MIMVLEMNPGSWQIVNDGVMGGISSSRMVEADGVLNFEGELSLENNGGFASARRLVDADLSFEDFVPVFRGRRVPEAGLVVPASIKQIGFLLADKTPGPFMLEIRSIEFTGGH